MTFRRALAPVALALLLAGCGTHLNTARQIQANGLRIHARDNAAALIDGLRTMAAGLNTFSGIVSFWETDGKDVQTSTAEVYTARPGKIRANITEASQALKRGVKLVYLGDKKVVAKIGFIKKTFAYDDTQVTSMHNWRIDQTDLGALIGGLTDAAGTATDLGPATVNGATGEAVQVTSPSLLPGVSKEVVVLNPATFVPMQLEAFIGDKVVYRIVIAKPAINPTLPADIFVL
jgi:outer membrane lipoprotein-sorting protein